MKTANKKNTSQQQLKKAGLQLIVQPHSNKKSRKQKLVTATKPKSNLQ
jgi:hypothetical protein